MSIRVSSDEHFVSLDEDDIQWQANPAHASTPSHPPSAAQTATGTSETPRLGHRPKPSATPALDALTTRVFKPSSNSANPIEHLEPQDKHPAISTLEHKLNATLLELADFWFCQPSPYDHVCLAKQNWRYFSPSHQWHVGEFFTRGEFHFLLYDRLIKRVAAVGMLLERGWEVLDGGASATDRALSIVVESLVHGASGLAEWITDWPVRGRKGTLMIDHPRLLRAIHVVRMLPLRFKVKIAGAGCEGKGKGKDVAQEMLAFVWFKDGRRDFGKEDEREWWEGRKRNEIRAWVVEVEVVDKKDAEEFVGGREYEV